MSLFRVLAVSLMAVFIMVESAHAQGVPTAKKARSLNQAGMALYQQSRYDEALSRFEEALAMSRSLGDQAGIIRGLNNTGEMYKIRGRYDKALSRFEEALAIDRRNGDDSGAALRLNNIAAVYREQGRYDEALSYFDEALIIARRLDAEAGAAVLLSNIGSIYQEQSRYDEALRHFEQALAVFRRLGQEAQAALLLNNIGSVYQAQSRYDEALSHLKEALAVGRRLGDEAGVATRLNNVGTIYQDQGRYRESLPYHEEALEIFRRLGREAEVAMCIANIGQVYDAQDRHDEALLRYEEALQIFRRLGNADRIGVSLGNIAGIYADKNHLEEALTYYQASLEISRLLGDEAGVAASLSNMGVVYQRQERFEEALSHYNEALVITQRLGREADVATFLSNIGSIYLLQERYDKAETALENSIALLERIRQRVDGDARRDYLASQIYTYQFLTALRIRSNKPERAFAAAEQSAARRLVEKLSTTDKGFTVPSVATVKDALGDDTALLIFTNTGLGLNLGIIVLTREGLVATEVAEFPFVEDAYDTFGAHLIDLEGRTIEQRRQRLATAGRDAQAAEEMGLIESVVQFYRRLLVHTRHPTRSAQNVPQHFSDPDAREDLGHRFYDLLIAPVEEHVKGKTKLIIVPNGPLGFLPFETLVDDENRYLAERFDVRYAPSATVWHALQQNSTSNTGRKPLLAFGGAVYDPSTQSQDPRAYANAAQIKSAQRRAYADLTRGGDLDGTYAALGYGSWADLPGTRAEVEGLAETVQGAEVVTGPAVSEAEIKRRSEAGELAQYQMLHFATHGLVVPEVPELSALVLSQDSEANTAAGEDGYLRMAEIAGLNLNADVVTLSACETGLGQLIRGEGVVGLTQAFIEAGARGVSASLWQVSDQSTSVFMQEVYRKVQDEGLSFAEAHTAVKRGFIRGDYLSAWQAPYYWAPYVYYGRSEE